MTDPAATIDPQWVINTNTANIANALALYDPITATLAWFDTLRAIEDCINLPMADWDDDELEVRLYNLALPPLLWDPRPLLALRPRLVSKFSETFANRFQNLMIQGATIGAAFAENGLLEMTQGFLSVGTMIGYFQSRRRHFVALLHTLPSSSRRPSPTRSNANCSRCKRSPGSTATSSTL